MRIVESCVAGLEEKNYFLELVVGLASAARRVEAIALRASVEAGGASGGASDGASEVAAHNFDLFALGVISFSRSLRRHLAASTEAPAIAEVVDRAEGDARARSAVVIDRAVLHQLISGSGHLRHAPPGTPHKEWLHFCVVGEAIEVIANFSLIDESPHVALIVRAGGVWHGDVEPIAREDVRVERGTMNVDFGASSLRFTERGFVLELALTDHPLTAKLILEPQTMPLLRPNTPLDAGAIHWMVVPRLAASGTVFVGSQRFELSRAPAYHDHNWGRFAWGDDFAWQWGFGLPRASAAASASTDGDDARALAFVRLIDRARGRDVGHGLFFWKGAMQERIFREGELTITPSGHLRLPAIAKLPRAMALVAPELATDVPARVAIVARGRGDEVEVVFTAEDMVQVLIPNDRDLGVTAINEVSGRYVVRGTIGGAAIDFEGRGFFEALTISNGPRCEYARGQRPLSVFRIETHGFVAFLRASLDVLRVERADIYAMMCSALDGRVVRVRVGDEAITLSFSRSQVIECDGAAPAVDLATDAETIIDLCDAKLTLATAVRSDRLYLAATPANLIAFDEGLTIYLAGAMRSPSFPGLLHDYRADTQRSS